MLHRGGWCSTVLTKLNAALSPYVADSLLNLCIPSAPVTMYPILQVPGFGWHRVKQLVNEAMSSLPQSCMTILAMIMVTYVVMTMALGIWGASCWNKVAMKLWSWSWCHYYSAYVLCTCLISMAKQQAAACTSPHATASKAFQTRKHCCIV